jgi:hypothetical protein
MISRQNKSGSQKPGDGFQWLLQGLNLTITVAGEKSGLETEFTKRNQLSLTPPALRGLRVVFKPERSKPLTNEPAKQASPPSSPLHQGIQEEHSLHQQRSERSHSGCLPRSP